MDKKLKREIGQIAAKLAPSYYSADQKVLVMGSALINQGQTEHNGKPIDPNKQYWATVEYSYPVNHARRMIKAYIQSGNDGLVEYIKGQREIHEPKQPIKLN